jgi:hypothetical protein
VHRRFYTICNGSVVRLDTSEVSPGPHTGKVGNSQLDTSYQALEQFWEHALRAVQRVVEAEAGDIGGPLDRNAAHLDRW